MRFREVMERLHEPDAELARVPRRFSAITVLFFLCCACLLFPISLRSSTAPSFFSLFLGDLVVLTPLLFRNSAAAAAVIMAVLLFLLIHVHAAMRRNSR